MFSSSLSASSLSRRSFIKYSTLATATMLIGVGCNNSSQKSSLRIGCNLWPGNMPLLIAQEQGIFANNNLTVELKWFPAVADQFKALANNELDIVNGTPTDLFSIIDGGTKIKAFLSGDFSTGADAVVVAPSIKTIADLKGKKIAVEMGFVDHLLLLQALEAGGLSAQDVEIINTPSDKVPQELASNKVQAISTYEPFVTESVQKAKGTILFSSADTPGLVPNIFMARQEVIDQQPEALERLIKAWFAAVDYRTKNLEEVLPMEAKQAGVASVEEYKTLLKGLTLLTAQKAASTYQEGLSAESILIAGRTISNFLVEQKVLKNTPPKIEDAIDNRFLQKYVSS